MKAWTWLSVDFTFDGKGVNDSVGHQKPKTVGDHIWISTLVATLVNVGESLRPVDSSTSLCERLTDSHTNNWFYNLSNAANASGSVSADIMKMHLIEKLYPKTRFWLHFCQ